MALAVKKWRGVSLALAGVVAALAAVGAGYGEGDARAAETTPNPGLRALCTDRPTKSTSPCTVDAGHIQVESDIFNMTEDRGGGLTTTTWLATNPTIKLGLTNTLDGEVNFTPFVSVRTRNRSTGQVSRISGVGDLALRLKWSLLGDAGGPVGFALSPFIKLPTARVGIGNGAVEGGLIAPINFNLPAGWSLVVDPEIDVLRNAADDGRHINSSGLVSLSHAVSKTLTLSGELWTDHDFGPGATRTQASADIGIAYIPAQAPNWQLDGGVNFGLNRETPTAQAYVGVSRRF